MIKSLQVFYQEKVLLISTAQCKINKDKIWMTQLSKKILWNRKIKLWTISSQLLMRK